MNSSFAIAFGDEEPQVLNRVTSITPKPVWIIASGDVSFIDDDFSEYFAHTEDFRIFSEHRVAA